MKDLQSRLEPGPTKRILALDGGGVRGLITLGILEAIDLPEDTAEGQASDPANFR